MREAYVMEHIHSSREDIGAYFDDILEQGASTWSSQSMYVTLTHESGKEIDVSFDAKTYFSKGELNECVVKESGGKISRHIEVWLSGWWKVKEIMDLGSRQCDRH